MKLIKIFYEKYISKNKLPVNFSEKDSKTFQGKDSMIKINQSGLYLLKNVFVTYEGIIYKGFFSIKENIVCYDYDFKKYKFRYFLKSFLKSTYQKCPDDKKYIIIFDNYSGPNGFAHWICDGLTRLAEMNDDLINYTLVVPSYFKEQSFYSESLKLFPTKSIHYLENNSLTLFKKLYFPSHIANTGNFHPKNIEKLREIVTTKIGQRPLPYKNIYISRAKANRRFLKNEIDVLELLKKNEFEIIYLEDYNLLDQINIICDSKNIISIHGAALSLIMFMKEGGNVLELRSNEDTTNNMYYILANVSKLNYFYLNCLSEKISGTGNNFDLTLDYCEFQDVISRMLKDEKTHNYK